MKKKSDLLAMQEMADNEEDIRMSPYLVSANKAKAGGHVIMGVDEKVIHDLAFNGGNYLVAFYIVNKEQFMRRKNESSEIDPEDLWDRYSELVSDTPSDFDRYSSRNMMTKNDFLKAIKELKKE